MPSLLNLVMAGLPLPGQEPRIVLHGSTGSGGVPGGVPGGVSGVRTGADIDLRVDALLAVARLSDPQSVPGLLRLTRSREKQVRLAALYGLCGSPTSSIGRSLASLIRCWAMRRRVVARLPHCCLAGSASCPDSRLRPRFARSLSRRWKPGGFATTTPMSCLQQPRRRRWAGRGIGGSAVAHRRAAAGQ